MSVGVVILTHGGAGAEMLATLARLLGSGAVAGMAAVDCQVGETRGSTQDHLQSAIESVDTGQGVVVVVDLFGSTPMNCALELAQREHVVVVAGVNLPMLVKLATAPRDTSPEAVAQAAVETAMRSIRIERARS